MIYIFNMNLLSVVVPCYNEEESLEFFLDEIQNTLADYNYEVIFINDGSEDSTLEYFRKNKKFSKFKSKCQVYFIFKKFWKGICNLCRSC